MESEGPLKERRGSPQAPTPTRALEYEMLGELTFDYKVIINCGPAFLVHRKSLEEDCLSGILMGEI